MQMPRYDFWITLRDDYGHTLDAIHISQVSPDVSMGTLARAKAAILRVSAACWAEITHNTQAHPDPPLLAVAWRAEHPHGTRLLDHHVTQEGLGLPTEHRHAPAYVTGRTEGGQQG
jgi:hypothetical protein